MGRHKLTPAEIRKEAARVARIWAQEADLMFNAEMAGEFRDLAKRIARIRLTEDHQ